MPARLTRSGPVLLCVLLGLLSLAPLEQGLGLVPSFAAGLWLARETRGGGLLQPYYLHVLTGLLALAITGAMLAGPVGSWAAAGLLMGWSFSPWLVGRFSPQRWDALSWLNLPLFVGITWWTGDGVAACAVLLAVVQLTRGASTLDVRSDPWALGLSAVQLAVASVHHGGPWMLPVVGAWVLVLPEALARIQLEQRRIAGPVAALTRPTQRNLWLGLVTLGLFLALPRPARPVVGGATQGGRIGFSDDVDLGDVAPLYRDSTVLLQMRVLQSPRPVLRNLYLRGRVLDTFDGRRWTASAEAMRVGSGREPEAGSWDWAVEIVQQRLAQGVLFAPGRAVSMQARGPVLFRDDQGAFYAPDWDRPVHYTAWASSYLDVSDVDVSILAEPAPSQSRYLSLPGELDGRLRDYGAFVLEMAGVSHNPSRITRLAALRDHLRQTDFRYALEGPCAGVEDCDEDPLVAFLFQGKQGHCEYFASALALMLRSVGIPSRVVTGFQGGEWAEDQRALIFRGYHAHAWVEVDLGIGQWARVDATPGALGQFVPPTTGPQEGFEDLAAQAQAPPFSAQLRSWGERVLDYGPASQSRALDQLGTSVSGMLPRSSGGRGVALLGTVALVVVLVVLRRTQRRRRIPGRAPEAWVGDGEVAHLYWDVRLRLSQEGFEPPRGLPPLEAARFLASTVAGEQLVELAWLHYQVRFGGTDEDSVLGQARALAMQITERLDAAEA